MQKIFSLLLFTAIITFSVCAQNSQPIQATTYDGKKVILYSNGTWKYSKNETIQTNISTTHLFVGKWIEENVNNSSNSIEISTQGENYLINGNSEENSELEGIYSLTKENNLSGLNGMVTIMYDKNSKKLLISAWGGKMKSWIRYMSVASTQEEVPPPPAQLNPSDLTVETAKPTATLTIIIDTDGKVSLAIDEPTLRVSLLKRMGVRYKIKYSPRELEAFSMAQSFDAPMRLLKYYLNIAPTENIKSYTGIPIDSEDNQLVMWIYYARMDNPNMVINIKTYKDTPNSIVEAVISILRNNDKNSYNLITE